MASRIRLLVALTLVAGMLFLPVGSRAEALGRCGFFVSNAKVNALRLNTNGVRLGEYRVTVRWCTAPNGTVAARVYSPRRTRSHSVTASGVLGGWRFDRVVSEKRGYFTYNNVQNGGYSVKMRVNFIRCQGFVVLVCSNKTGWLNTYVRYDRTAAAARGWE